MTLACAAGKSSPWGRPTLDLKRGVLHVRQSEWEGHLTLPKSGRGRKVVLTERLAAALAKNRHLRGPRVLWREESEGKVTQVLLAKWMRRLQRRAGLKETAQLHILRHTVSSTQRDVRAPAVEARVPVVGNIFRIVKSRAVYAHPQMLRSAAGVVGAKPSRRGSAYASAAMESWFSRMSSSSAADLPDAQQRLAATAAGRCRCRCRRDRARLLRACRSRDS